MGTSKEIVIPDDWQELLYEYLEAPLVWQECQTDEELQRLTRLSEFAGQLLQSDLLSTEEREALLRTGIVEEAQHRPEEKKHIYDDMDSFGAGEQYYPPTLDDMENVPTKEIIGWKPPVLEEEG